MTTPEMLDVLRGVKRFFNSPEEVQETLNEIADRRSGERVLVNVAWVEEVRDDTIYYAFQQTGAVEPDYIQCAESYDEIKRMIWR